MTGWTRLRVRGDSRQRIGITAGVGALVGVLMVLVGMEPRLVLVGFVVVSIAASTWLVADLAVTATPINWHDYGTVADGSARPDRRVQLLRARLRQTTQRRRLYGADDHNRPDPSAEIADTLVGVLDDYLIAEYGVHRSIDSDTAAELLGAELTRFVTDPAARRSLTQRRTLANTIALIEDFTSPTDAT